MARKAKTTNGGEVKEKKARKPRAPRDPNTPHKLRKVAGYNPETKIIMAKDEEGKPYGANNNPKREGSKAADHFSRYKSNVTIKSLVDAGVPPGDIAWNLAHGLIEIAA